MLCQVDLRLIFYTMLVLSLLLLCASAFAFVPRTDKPYHSLEDADKYFEDFMNTYDVNYSSETEKQARFEIFKQNLEDINQMNSDPEQPAVFGITKFSDLTKEEFRKMYTGVRINQPVPCPDTVPVTMDLPDNFDWRNKNAVTPMKNQGQVGTCWTFSTTGTVEGAYAIKHGQLKSFSEQQLVDCDKSNNGLDGGWPYKALKYLEKYGAEGEEDYPYTESQSQCAYDPSKVRANITGQIAVAMDQDDALQQTLIQYGPISFTVLVEDYWQGYKGGIMNGTHIACPAVNHAVLLVGYGTENGVPYWLIKNSWGTGWGQEGYLKLMRKPAENPCAFRCYPGVIAKVA